VRQTSVGDLVHACIRSVRAEADARGVQLEARVGDGVSTIRCAPDHVQRVLLNLLTNALRHTPADGSIAVVAEPVDGELHVLVEDTGSGLSREASQRMFERFWRGDPSRTRASGNAGLGLAIARGLVEAHGGRVWAENRDEGGARVAFALPLAA
jgi:signal transduction histidine kinase